MRRRGHDCGHANTFALERTNTDTKRRADDISDAISNVFADHRSHSISNICADVQSNGCTLIIPPAVFADAHPISCADAPPNDRANALGVTLPIIRANRCADQCANTLADAIPNVYANSRADKCANVHADALPSVHADSRADKCANVHADAFPSVHADRRADEYANVHTDRTTDPCATCFSFVVSKYGTGANTILCSERPANASIDPLVNDTVGADPRAAALADVRAGTFADTDANGSQL